MTTEINDAEMEQKADEIYDFFASGGSLGTMAGLTGDDFEAIYAIAYNFFTAHKYDKAIEMFQYLCMNDHTEARWFYGLGVAKQAARDYDGALAAYAMATVLDVENPVPQAQAGFCLMAVGKTVEAQAALEGAIMACGDNPEYADTKAQAETLLKTINEQKTDSGEKKA